ncbi:hypothetical protein CBS14141_002741 [Malassezia furfur]|nr:hypothetical protein CBS14141_002741 [Malassezia furfur]
MTAAPTRQQLLALYRQHLSAARSFAKSVHASASALANVATSNSGGVRPMEPLSGERLAEFYRTAREELKVLQRAAIVNMMYSSDRLVVEDEQQKDWIIRAGAEGAGAGEDE